MPDTVLAPAPHRPFENSNVQCGRHRIWKIAILRPARGTAGVSFSDPACPYCAREAANLMSAELKWYYAAELVARMGVPNVIAFMTILPRTQPDPKNFDQLATCLHLAATLKGQSIQATVGDLLIQGRFTA